MYFQKPPLGTPLDWGNPLNDETVMALAMNEGYGDKVQDLSLNGNHGTLNNFAFPSTATSGWNPGQTGIGINFDGTNDYIDCGNNPSLLPTNGFTFGALVKLSALNKYQGVMGKAANIWSNTAYSLRIKDSNVVEFITSADGTAVSSLLSTIPLAANIWYNIVTTFKRPTKTIYINGVQRGTGSWDNDIYQSTANLGVGLYAYGAGLSYTMDGSIDQPRIQSRAWSAKEVRDYAINPWQVYLDE